MFSILKNKKIICTFRDTFGVVRYSSYLSHLDILDQNRILEDGYNEYYSYDDCILDNVAKNYNIKDILKSEENKMISEGIEESMFKHVSNELENMKKLGDCNEPNLKLQTSFTLASLDFLIRSTIGLNQPFRFGLEFSQSTLVKEVN